MKVASYPALARQALLEDQGERFNLDRTYAALSGATDEKEREAATRFVTRQEAKRAEVAARMEGDSVKLKPRL